MIDLLAIFRRAGDHLFWERLEDDHVVDGGPGLPIEIDEAYFIVRMKEMYLGRIRLLWRKYYPLLYGFTEARGEQARAVSGPGQLQDLGNVNLEKVLILNERLAGPTPYRGGDVSLLVGLYSVPGQDLSKALMSTVIELAAVAGPEAWLAAELTDIVKQGVDSILSLGETKLQLAVRDSFYPNDNPLRSGYYVGVAAPTKDVDSSKLWLKEGRLVWGDDPIASKPYTDHGYMVIAVERLDRRDDWPALPQLAEFSQKFETILADNATNAAQKRRRLNELWPAFQQTLAGSKFLTRPDAWRIAGSVQEDLKVRLKAIDAGGPFETRSWGDSTAQPSEPTQFELSDVPDYIDPADPESASVGAAALTGPPSF